MAEESVHFAGFSVDEQHKKESLRFLKAIWLQYSQAFNNSYDEHLIFETMNEPINCFHEHDWHPQDDCSVCKKNYSILKLILITILLVVTFSTSAFSEEIYDEVYI